jgi:hypothetical protein
MTLFINFFAASQVPLKRRGWFIFHNIMITNPILIADYEEVIQEIPANLRTSFVS